MEPPGTYGNLLGSTENDVPWFPLPGLIRVYFLSVKRTLFELSLFELVFSQTLLGDALMNALIYSGYLDSLLQKVGDASIDCNHRCTIVSNAGRALNFFFRHRVTVSLKASFY